jgi:hypothetical protein
MFPSSNPWRYCELLLALGALQLAGPLSASAQRIEPAAEFTTPAFGEVVVNQPNATDVGQTSSGFELDQDSGPQLVDSRCDPLKAQPSACPQAFGDWSGLFDNLSFFGGLDGSKQPQDFGINAQFGGRASVNWGIPVVKPLGIGFQVGTAIDATADAVQVTSRIEGSAGRTQSFTTVGLFQRTEFGLSWGFAYDFLSESYYDSFTLGQWRLDLDYQLSPNNSIGVWSAISDRSDQGQFGSIPITLTPITQTNFYINHIWENNVRTMVWAGVANGHGQVNAVLGDLPRLKNTFEFGSQLEAPLNDHWAVFGQANFIMPADSGTVDAYLGLVYYLHGAARAHSSQFEPLQTVAAPTNFAVDLRR